VSGDQLALSGNPRVRIREVEVLSDAWYVLRRTTFEFERRDGTWSREQRENYDRGDGATILLYDARAGRVLLTRQFRLPAYVNGHPNGMLIEAPAGLLEDEGAEESIRREAEEETGVRVGEVERIFEVYMSPGSVTERVAFFAAPYTPRQRVSDGGGLADDGEDIEVLELGLGEALAMLERGEIVDAKTIMLLQWAERRGLPAG
jgi:nudix-type nucleoside diphosphatase (YffH/AdpP family)